MQVWLIATVTKKNDPPLHHTFEAKLQTWLILLQWWHWPWLRWWVDHGLSLCIEPMHCWICSDIQHFQPSVVLNQEHHSLVHALPWLGYVHHLIPLLSSLQNSKNGGEQPCEADADGGCSTFTTINLQDPSRTSAVEKSFTFSHQSSWHNNSSGHQCSLRLPHFSSMKGKQSKSLSFLA